MHTYRHSGEPRSAVESVVICLQCNTLPQSEIGAQQTFRLERNSMKMDVGRPLMKVSAYFVLKELEGPNPLHKHFINKAKGGKVT